MYFQNKAGLLSTKISLTTNCLNSASLYKEATWHRTAHWQPGDWYLCIGCEGLVMHQLVILRRLLLCTKYQHKFSSVYH